MSEIPDNVALRFIAMQLRRMDQRIDKLEENMNERFQRSKPKLPAAKPM